MLGKQVVRTKDRSGFVVNALLIPYLLSAIRMYESGMASLADIDKAMKLGCAHPMGPFGLIDLIGLDIVQAISESLYGEYREPHYSPPPLLARMVSAGLLGKKSGRGFYEYAPAAAGRPCEPRHDGDGLVPTSPTTGCGCGRAAPRPQRSFYLVGLTHGVRRGAGVDRDPRKRLAGAIRAHHRNAVVHDPVDAWYGADRRPARRPSSTG